MDATTPTPEAAYDPATGVASAPGGEILVSRREGARAGLVLALLLALAYANVIFGGRSLLYSNSRNPMDERGSEANYGPGFVRPGKWMANNLLPYPNFHDPGGAWWQWEPSGEFLRTGLLRGEPPFWDPYSGAGTPAMANVMPTAFYPPYLLMVLAGNTALLRTLYALATLWASGWFAFLWLRKHGLEWLPALLGGAVWIFSGAMAQNVGSFIGQAAATLPVALWLTRRFLDRPSSGRAAALAAGTAGLALASFPPVLVLVFGFVASYALASILARERTDRRDLGRWWTLSRWAAAQALGVALVAFYYLPFAALVRAAPHVGEAYGDGGLESLPAVCLLQLASPTLAGGGKVFLDPPVPDPFRLQLPYLGGVALLLAFAASRRGAGWSRAFLPVLVGGVLLAVAKVLGLAPVQWLGLVPGLANVHFAAYLGILLDFLLAALAAVGLQSLVAGGVSRVRVAAIGGGAALLAANLFEVARDARALDHPEAADWLWPALVWAAMATAAVVALARAALRAGEARRRAVVALLALFAVEALVHTAYRRPKRWDLWRRPPPYVDLLRAEAGHDRVFAAATFEANAGSAFEVATLDSLATFNSTRVWRLYGRYTGTGSPFFLREPERLPPEGVLDRAAIRLLVLRRAKADLVAEAERRGWATLFEDEQLLVYRRPGSARWYFTSDFRETDRMEAMRGIGRLPPGRELLLEKNPGVPPAPNREDDPPVEVVTWGRNRYRLAVDAPRPGLLYAAESQMPGWSARVDGRSAEILAANYAFRAVAVPAGRHTVEFSYWPPGLTPGLWISALALAGVLGLASVRRIAARPSFW